MTTKGRLRSTRRAIAHSGERGSGSVSAAGAPRACRAAIAAWLVASLAACGGAGADTRPGAGASAAAGTTPGAAESAATGARATRTLRVVFVGTSLTAGLGLEPDSAFPALIQRKADSAGVPVRVVNAGVSGETSAGALRRIDWVMRDPADVVVLETGANDGLRALPVASTRANLEQIVRRIRAAQPAAQVVLVQMEAPPNLGVAYTTAFHGMFPAVAKAEGVTLAGFLLEDVAGESSLNQADGIHPNEAGARRVADNLWPTLAPVLRSAAGAPVGAPAGVGAAGGGAA
jgi:acyl-CoA thioesterase-1